MGENEVAPDKSSHFQSARGPRSARQLALFGINSGVAWVAEDAFVTRRGEDLLVERWIGDRVAAIVVSAASSGKMRMVWEALSNIAVDDLPTDLRGT